MSRTRRTVISSGTEAGISQWISTSSSNPDIAEHHHRKQIVELQADRSGLRAPRFARILGDHLPIQSNANPIAARLNIERVPLAFPVRAGLRRDEAIDAAGRVRLFVVIDDLDLIPDLRGRGLG